MDVNNFLPAIPSWFSPFWFLIVILFGVELLVPRLWILIEQTWWRLWLGNSLAGRLLRRYAMEDFQASIEQRVTDGAIPRPLAVIMAVASRPFELKRLTHDLRGKKAEMVVEMFESAIEQLNKLWREGTPPRILNEYIKNIENSECDAAIDRLARLWGRCAIAIVKYALGKIREGNELGKENWEEANQLESREESTLKWLASYGYFNSTLFLGNPRAAMVMMAKQWSRYYAPLSDGQKKELRERLSGKLILNPILAIPRHIILAAAFNESPIFQEEYWPNASAYRGLDAKGRVCKIKWVEAWYEEAKRICAAEPTSLNFSHAYTAFYLTLLLLEPGAPSAYLHSSINEAFSKIDDSAAIVAQYVKFGFSGVYHLICEENEKALDYLGRAASFSAISGNRFADCIFMCCHAVAAARLTRPSRYMEPDINYYLSEAEKIARTINRDFYKKLCDGAHAAVYLQKGEKAKAHRYAQRSLQGMTGNRILRIFQNDALDTRKVEARESAFNLLGPKSAGPKHGAA
jgi:hypothetical protein